MARLIKKFKFYWHRDTSKPGIHPSYVYKKNDEMNKYNIVCFTSSKGKKRTKLNRNINPKSKEDCYALNNPKISKRNSFGNELYGYRITDSRDKETINRIASKKK